MEELWKPISGYEGLYEVSNLGRIRSVDRTIILKNGQKRHLPSVTIRQRLNKRKKYNYSVPLTTLSKGSITKSYRVSSIVCETFHGPRPDGYVCMHLDGNPQNNRADNLSWGTVYENSNEPIRRRRISDVARWNIPNLWRRGVYDSQLKPCLQFSKSGEFIAEFSSLNEAERKTGVRRETISRACRGRLRTSGGFIWKFKNA